jgi:hypothetical protein
MHGALIRRSEACCCTPQRPPTRWLAGGKEPTAADAPSAAACYQMEDSTLPYRLIRMSTSA